MTDQDPYSPGTRVQRRIALGRLLGRPDAELREAAQDDTPHEGEGGGEPPRPTQTAGGSRNPGDQG